MPGRTIWKSLERAFVAGEPKVEPIVNRVQRLLGRPWRWIRPVARRYVRLFGDGIRPRQREVAAFLQSRKIRVRTRLSVKEWLTEPQEMRPMPAAAGWPVPAIESAGQLAEWMRLAPTELDWFADLKGLAREGKMAHYHYRVLSKYNGSLRVIEAPKPRLKRLQRLVLAEIVEEIPAHPAVHGFRKGRSILTFVAPHVGRRVVLRMDLEDFFPSIAGVWVQTLFRAAGYPENVADLLGGICTNAMPTGAAPIYRRPHLPQGAPSSPALANLCAFRLDCRLAGLAEAAGAQYTRYADDLAFSGGEEFERSVERFLLHAAAVAMEEGFTVNHRKTRVMRQGVRQHLAGLCTNAKANVMRPDYDRLKAILTNCVRTGPQSQNREGHPRFREHLLGRVAFVESVNPAKGRRLRDLFEKINWR
jgi:RNA-directed DNA polymerase